MVFAQQAVEALAVDLGGAGGSGDVVAVAV